MPAGSELLTILAYPSMKSKICATNCNVIAITLTVKQNDSSRVAQFHYRKSEPEYYPCLSPRQWKDMSLEGYGGDYRLWHLVLCLDCFTATWDLGFRRGIDIKKPRVEFHVRP